VVDVTHDGYDGRTGQQGLLVRANLLLAFRGIIDALMKKE